MYNLKEIYGVITFNDTSLRIGVFDTQTPNQKNCLYYTYADLNPDPYTTNITKTKGILAKKLLSVDKFIGLPVKRYLICFNELSMEVRIHTTETITCNDEVEANKFINENNLKDIDENYCSLKKEIIAYHCNNQIYDTFPIDTNQFKITYLDYYNQQDLILIKNIISLLHACNVQVLGCYNIPIAYQKAHEKTLMNQNHVLIDVHQQQINIYQYDTSNKITQITNLNFGTNWLEEELEITLGIDRTSLKHLIKCLDSNMNLDQSLVVANIHQNVYLNVKQIHLKEFYTIMNLTIDHFFTKITNCIQITNVEYWEMNCENAWHNLFYISINDPNNPITINTHQLHMDQESVPLMDNCHINSLIWTINATKYEQASLDENICSIDPYVAEKIINRQFEQSLILKLGIFSTGAWAKLGSSGE